jgi:glycosyltransferase involved in cell wall biosynthesis
MSTTGGTRPAAADGLTIGVVGPVPPHRSNMAEETAWMASKFAERGAEVRLVAVTDHQDANDRQPGRLPWTSSDQISTVAEWRAGTEGAERAGLRVLAGADAVVVHHQLSRHGHGGLHGPDDAAGSPLVRFLQRCPAPTVLVLHDVPSATDPASRDEIQRLVRLADAVIVQSEVARRRTLAADGDVDLTLSGRSRSDDHDRVHIVPRAAVLGAPTATPHSGMPRPGRASRDGMPTVLTFGFLDPEKAVEDAVVAVAELDDLSAPVRYEVCGPTASDVLDLEGEHYRSGLRILAKALKVDDRVLVQDGYLPASALARKLAEADAVVLPYQSHDTTSSAALVEALAAGRPVVATAFPHAVELLSDGAGILVAPGDRAAMTSAIRTVLARPRTAAAMSQRAAEVGRQFHPDRVLDAYLDLLGSLRNEVDLRAASTPPRHGALPDAEVQGNRSEPLTA